MYIHIYIYIYIYIYITLHKHLSQTINPHKKYISSQMRT